MLSRRSRNGVIPVQWHGDGAATADKASSDLGAEARNLAEQVATKASNVLKAGRDYVNRARSAGQGYAEQTYEAGSGKPRKRLSIRNWVMKKPSLVWRHPVKALAIPAGVGFLVGLITARR